MRNINRINGYFMELASRLGPRSIPSALPPLSWLPHGDQSDVAQDPVAVVPTTGYLGSVIGWPPIIGHRLF